LNNRQQKAKISLFLWIFILFLAMASSALASSSAPSVNTGILLYQEGQYNEAIEELQAALKEDPENPQALKYLHLAKQSLSIAEMDLPEQSSFMSTSTLPTKVGSQEELINKTLDKFEALNQFEKNYLAQKKPQTTSTDSLASKQDVKPTSPAISSPKQNVPSNLAVSNEPQEIQGSIPSKEPLGFSPKEDVIEAKPSTTSIYGNVHMGVGYETAGDGDFLWKQANFNLNEKNYRVLSADQLNRRENTFDPAIYDRMEINLDAEPLDSPLSFHTNITVDPWSYVGRSEKMTLQGTDDTADLQLLYVGNTAYTVGQIIDTSLKGDAIAVPELKVVNNRVAATTLYGRTYWPWAPNEFALPETKITTWFQPIRELWMDYEPNEAVKLEIFPLGLENKALTTDDPLRLSNNRTWWEESPWLASWRKGQYNPDVTDVWGNPTTPDFTKGRWDDALAFATRDSEARRLTALRGISAEFNKDDTEIEATVASPKTLWQDYDVLDALATSVRAKQHLSDQLYIGTLGNAHLGFVDQNFDSYNLVTGFDTGWMPTPSSKISAEYAFSYTKQDLTNDTYESNQRGSAYDMQIMGTSSYLSGADQNYFSIQPGEEEINFYKTSLRLSRMDKGFQSSLSSYLETRDDEFWSRHITFREPMNFQTIGYNDIDPFRIGNGIDYDRYTINWRSDFSFFNQQIKGLTDIRNVHQASTDKYVETVARTEWGWQPTNCLETKLLLLAHHLPSTTGGLDPFMTDPETGPIDNDSIADGEDASLYTASTGLKYWLTDWVAWDGTWERTNDFTVATDNYPRGIFNDTSVTTSTSYGNIYRQYYPFLYDQGYFPLPPYEYHNIFRTGVTFRPSSQWDIYLDYTYNPNEFAGPIDDNINHVGFSVAYAPSSRLQLYAKYTWIRSNDLNVLLNNDEIKFESHHNVFFETQYLFKDDSCLTASFGVGPSIYNAYASSTPYVGSTYPTLDTQKMFRLSYTKNF
jgi:tetratricopeptide (TPR) repeat protein